MGTAAKAAGISKATVHRAIKDGRISATRLDDGSYSIEPCELHRIFPPVSAEPPATVATGVAEQPVRRSETPAEPPETVDAELAIANARLEAEIAGLRELLRVHRDQVDDLRGERDRLLGQVETAHRLLTHHQTAPAPEPAPEPMWQALRRRLVG